MTSQDEFDIERHVLTQTKKLTDNSTEKIFSRNSRNEYGLFTYNCHLCAVALLSGERALQMHITGKKHQQRLMYDYVPDAVQFRLPIAPKPRAAVFPGEPAPPGYEDEVNTMSYLESIGNKQKKPLIGMEYVVELIDNKAKEPFYICTLCDKRCDPRNILPQITSHRHRMKYLETHFNNVMDALNRNQKFNVDMTYREEILTSIAGKIETNFKRLKPHICEYREFERNKAEIVDQLKLKRHFTAEEWPECDRILLENVKCVNHQEFETVSSESENEFNDFRLANSMRSVRARNLARSRSRSPGRKHPSAFSRLEPSLKQDNQPEVRKILTPRELSEQSNAKMHEKYVLEKYKASVEIAVKEQEKKFKEFEKSPEKHPLYSDEWKAFWSRRYKELIAQGKDANGHDYKPEWIKFWTQRMRDLFDKNIGKIKNDFRKKLGLTAEAVKRIAGSSPVAVRSNRRASRSRSPPRLARTRKRSESPIKISDDSDDDRLRRSEPRKKAFRSDYGRRSEERSRSRFSEDSPYSRQSDYRSKDCYDSTYYCRLEQERNNRSKSPEIVDDGPVNVVSVCRLLSALEGELGLLAKNVIDLLGKAVALEKLKPNSADQLLLNSDNCNVLETVKEKLKGVLTANLISSNKTVAVKRAIQNIATLLHEASTIRPSTSNGCSTSNMGHGNSSRHLNDVNSFDDVVDPVANAKLEIAKVITASLLEQGRSNVTAEELEALVESFMESADDQEPEPEPEPEPEEKIVEKVTKIKSTPSPMLKSSKGLKERETPSTNGLENLTDEDLQTLLRNFADLTSDEQSHLIAYLSKIEQTNPTRVEKLRQYVNIGDADNDDTDDANQGLDMDFIAAGSSDKATTKKGKKSPEPAIKHDLSDDDYDDDAMVKKLGMNRTSSTIVAESSNIMTTKNALKDNSGLADSLMSSLMQSSLPTIQRNTDSWETGNQSDVPFYQHPQMSQFPNMMPMYNNQQMNMGVPSLSTESQMMAAQQNNQWHQNSGSNYYRDMEHLNKNNNNRKRFDKAYNNRQLTGKGINRR